MKDKIEITENAQNHIAKVISQDDSNYFRITVMGGGCSGFKYEFSFDGKPEKEDLKFNQILIDKNSAEMLKGSEVDYVSEVIGNSFKISNPQSKSSCGCGVSFAL